MLNKVPDSMLVGTSLAAINTSLAAVKTTADTAVKRSGDTMTGNLEIENAAPIITLTETDTGKKYIIVVDGSDFSIREDTLGADPYPIYYHAASKTIKLVGQDAWTKTSLRQDANGNLEVYHEGAWRKVSTPTMVASTNVKESFPTERVGLSGNHMLVAKHIPQGVGEVLITADLDYVENSSTQLVLVTPTVYTNVTDAAFEPRNNTQRFDWRTPLGTNIVFDFSYGYHIRQHSLLSRGSSGYVTLSAALSVKDKTPLYIFLTGSNGCKVKNITIGYDVV